MTGLLGKCVSDPALKRLLEGGRLEAARDLLLERVESYPADPVPLAWAALIDLELGRVEQATEHAVRAINLAPDTALTQNVCGQAYLAANRLDEADKCFRRAQKLDKSDVSALLGTGALLHRQRRFDEATDFYLKSIAQFPDDADLYNELGRALNNKGELLKARDAFQHALEKRADFHEAHHNLGHVYRRMSDPDKATVHFLRALEIRPDYFSARYNLGTVYLSEEKLAPAENCFLTALELDPAHAPSLCKLGICLLRLDRLDEAETSLRKSLELDSHSIESWVNLALTLRAKGDTQASCDAYRRGRDLDPSDPGLACGQVAVLAELGEVSEAVAVTEQILNTPPVEMPIQMADDYMNLGHIMRTLGRLDLAISSYQRSLDIRPSGAEVQMFLAGTQIETGDVERGLTTIDRCLEINPGYQSGIALKITALRRLGRREEAHKLLDLERFIRISDVPAPENYRSVSEFNENLVQRVLAEPSLKFERAGHATRKGRHTGSLDIESDGPFRDLAGLIDNACREYMDQLGWQEGHPLLGRRPLTWKLQMWSVVMSTQGHQIPHTHDDGFLSGVYYPQLPEVVGDTSNDEAGWIEFGRPLEELVGDSEPDVRRIRPKTGRLAVFPSYFVHRTIPFESEQHRVSIAFDLMPLTWVTRDSGTRGG